MTDTFKIEMLAMAHGGSALGRHEKKTIFIPYTIPGEIVEAHIKEDKGRIAFAEGVKLVDASADRVFPRCPHFGPGRCGRCHWQHIDYPAQLLLKQDVLADQLARIGGFDDADVQPVIPSPQQWGYHYQMTFVTNSDGQIGFIGADDPLYIVEECHILHPDLLDLYERLDMDFSGLQKLRLQIGTSGSTMLIFYVDDEDDAPELMADLKTSVNVVLPTNEPANFIGDTHTRYEIGDKSFRVTAGSDFRANIAQIEALATLVAVAVPDGAAVLDLYGGVGVFSAYIASKASLITLVDSFPPAVTDAEENLAEFDNIDLIEGTVEDVLIAVDDPYDVIVLDPPSEGLSVEVIDALGELLVPRLVYVSSDPATLARDAKRLVQHGYELTIVQPIDLHPQTYYIDSVAIFNL